MITTNRGFRNERRAGKERVPLGRNKDPVQHRSDRVKLVVRPGEPGTSPVKLPQRKINNEVVKNPRPWIRKSWNYSCPTEI